MALIGDGFVDYVKKQITTRQKALGEYDNRNIKNTKAFMTRTPWVRMVSSVDLTEGNEKFPGNSVLSTIKSSGNYSGIDLSGDNLAKKFILFNGISNEKGGIDNLYSGITGGPLSGFGGAYGFGSRDDIQTERGFVPMPGITNVNFQYKNDGALATATVQIKVFNRSQFQLIDVLFQRPGYTVLLEFGSTVYLDNSGNLVEASYDTLPFQHIFKTDQNMFTLHEVIAKEKAKWNGNYEGFFAKITKWNWKFNPDGSYDITVNLIGMGDVIESLKINVALDKKSSEKIDDDNNEGLFGLFTKKSADIPDPVISSAKKSRLNASLYNIYRSVKNNPSQNVKYGVKLPNYISFEKDKDGFVTKINPPTPFVINHGAVSISNTKTDEEIKYDPQTYITLGTLLALITSNLSISGKNGEENITPYILFDINLNNYLLDDNYITTFPGNFSSDPNVCLIPYQPLSPDITDKVNLPNTVVNDILKISDYFSVDNNPLIGRMINIYINIGFILKTFESSINENDEVILIDFLRNILTGINNSLGGLNNFRVIHNKDTNLFEIRSEVNLNVENNPKPSSINTFGVVKGEGSFVREIDFHSELTDRFAAMTSIGAQADGSISQNNSTAFSIYNKGLVDRVIKEKVDTTKTDTNENKIEDLFTDDIIECFNDVYNNKKFINDNISILSNKNSQYCKLISGKLTQLKKAKAPFFLPFNLGVTIDGLSGIRIYQSFQVDGKVLPLTYNSKDIQLIITSLSHDISPDGWLTKIETIAGPIFEVLPSLAPGKYGELPNTPTLFSPPPSTSDVSTPVPPPVSNINPLGRREAMEKSYNTVFGTTKQDGRRCGRFTFDLAKYYVKYLKIPKKALDNGGLDAKSSAFRAALLSLGYTATNITSGDPANRYLSPRKVKEIINSTQWGYGDVVTYYSPIYTPGNRSNSHEVYGHAQIYIGDISGIPSQAPNKNNSGWASSYSNNYGTSFVYGNRTNQNWVLTIYRAPSIVSSVGTPSIF
jgi:hypothetical protein